jgi:hypothetical protein
MVAGIDIDMVLSKSLSKKQILASSFDEGKYGFDFGIIFIVF